MVIVVAWAIDSAQQDRRTAMVQAELRTQSMADLAAEHVLRTIEGADTALRAVRTEIHDRLDWVALAQDKKTWQIIHDYGIALSAIPTLYLADDLGSVWVHGLSFPFTPISISEREYFQYHRSVASDDAFINPPIHGSVTNRQVIIVSRRLYSADGGFAGVVGATLRADAFQAFFQTLSLGEGAILNLQRNDGTILARFPYRDGAVGAKVDNAKAFPAITEGKASSAAITISPLDGVSRVTAFRRLDRYGLILLSAIPVEEVLVEWRRQSVRLAITVATGILVLSALFIMLLRRYHAEVVARAELKDSEETLTRAQRVAHIGSWHVDLIGDKVRWSEETYRIFGLEPGFPIAFSAVMAMIHPDDRHTVETAWAGLLAGGGFDQEHRIVTADGAVKWVHARAEMTSPSDGSARELLGTVQDITEKKLTETAIREHQSLLLEVQSVANLGYYDYDMRADHWRSSPILDDIFGITPEYPHSGQGWLALVSPAMRAEMTVYLSEIQAGAHDFDKSYAIIRPCDGEERWVAGLGKIERDAEGRPIRMVGTIKDITDQHRAEQDLRGKAAELERSNTELEQFAYVASHDLREPLRMVSSFVELLARRYGDKLDDDAREFIAFAKEGVSRMDHLIFDLLEFSRIGRITRPMVPTPLGPVIEQALLAMAVQIKEADAEISLASSTLPTVMGDDEELTRLIQNLIGNAIKYRSPERKPVISIEAERIGREWVLTFADNGIGIEPQYWDRIFLIFQRLHRRGEFEGTGIGLAVCKKIAEHHGGRIWVDSVPGGGSRFFVALPFIIPT